jgi:hypothetical protein
MGGGSACSSVWNLAVEQCGSLSRRSLPIIVRRVTQFDFFWVSKFNVFIIFWAIMTVCTLALCWLLLLSKQFGHEFAERGKTELRYKLIRILRNVVSCSSS